MVLTGQGTPAVTAHKWHRTGESEVTPLKGSSPEVTCLCRTPQAPSAARGMLSASCVVCWMSAGG